MAGAADGDDKQRLRAALRELERAKQRVERDAARVAAQTRDDLLARLLPLLDDLDRTIAAAPPGDLRDGVALVRDKFERVLADYGLERVPTVGHRFDPAVHEAVGVAPVAPDRDGEVVSEWQRGYRAGDRVLRAAKVVVGRAA
ncbi:MAG: nucleotide exchange factor GrpE [Deltaproteobacteria bacterium]|nr:MAG: nucleotide exchange factor GrpE [Deltaproteobacteria bacterium]